MGIYSDAGKQLDTDLSNINGQLTSLSSSIQGLNAAVDQLSTATKTAADAIGVLSDEQKKLAARISALESGSSQPPTQPPSTGCQPPVMTPPAKEPTGTNIVSVSTLSGATLTDKMNALPAGKELSFPANSYADPDFNRPSNYPVYCMFLAKPTALHGSGADRTILSAVPNSMSQSYKKLDSIVTPDTNPYRVVRVDAAKVIEDLQIKGTMQGTSTKTGKPYSYHGLQFYQTTNPTMRRCKLPDIPGSAGVPPDETFSVEAYRCSGTFTVEDCIFDAPSMEGSSAVTVNFVTNSLGVVLRRIRVTGHPNGHGWTIFNTALTSFLAEDFYTDGSMCGLNFEQVSVNGGAKVNNAKDSGIVIVRQEVRNPSNRITGYSHLCIDSSAAGNGVSNRVDIHDPVGIDANNKYGITISNGYGFGSVPKGAQAQRGADIHLWVGNTERNDLIRWLRTSGAA